MEINWAKVVAMTVVDVAKREKHGLPSRNQKLNGPKVEPIVYHQVGLGNDSWGSNIGVGERSNNRPLNHSSFSNTMSIGPISIFQYLAQISLLGICPFLMSTEDIVCVEELIGLNSEFLKTTKSEIIALQRKKTLNQDKLLGLKFSTQDKNVVFAQHNKDLEEKKEELNAKKKNLDSYFHLK